MFNKSFFVLGCTELGSHYSPLQQEKPEQSKINGFSLLKKKLLRISYLRSCVNFRCTAKMIELQVYINCFSVSILIEVIIQY